MVLLHLPKVFSIKLKVNNWLGEDEKQNELECFSSRNSNADSKSVPWRPSKLSVSNYNKQIEKNELK